MKHRFRLLYLYDMNATRGLVVVLFSFTEHTNNRCHQSQSFCCYNGQPNAVQLPDERKQQYSGDLEYQGTQNGKKSRYGTVIEGCKEGRTENRESGEQEREGIDQEGPKGNVQQSFVIAHIEDGKGLAQQFCGNEHHKREYAQNHKALSQQTLQLLMVLCSEVIADDGSSTDGVAKEDRKENQIEIHQNAIGCNSVLSGVLQKLNVIEDTNNGHGNIVEQLGRTIETDFEKGFPIKGCLGQAQETGIFSAEVDERDNTTDALAQSGSSGSTRKPPGKSYHKDRIQNDVGKPCCNGGIEAQIGLFRRGKETLKFILHHIGRGSQQINGT